MTRSYKAYSGDARQPGDSKQRANPGAERAGAPYGFFSPLAEMASMFSSKELAVVANLGSLVQPLTRAQYQAAQVPIPSNLFSHADQQQQWQSSIAQGNSPTGWGGRVADYVAAQGMNSSKFPTFLSVAGNTLEGSGVKTQMLAIAPGRSLALAGFNNSAASQARLNALTNLLTLNSGVSLAQAANSTMSMSIADAKALAGALGKAAPLKTQFPTTTLGKQLQQVAQIIQVQADLGMQRQVFFCSVGSFDTHTGEFPTLNTLYPELSQGLAAFYNATQELGVAQNVTTFTESDFNRTFQADLGGRQRPRLGRTSPGAGRGRARRPDLRHVPDVRTGRPGRYRHARPLDPHHIHRSIRRDVVLVVRDSRQRDELGVSESGEFQRAQFGICWLSGSRHRSHDWLCHNGPAAHFTFITNTL